MGFENLGTRFASVRLREARGIACNQESCGCATCPLGPNGSRACLGPNKKCDARNCDRDCQACRAVCNRRTDRDAVMSSIGGTVDFNEIRWRPFEVQAPPIMFQLNTPLKVPVEASGFVVSVRKLIYVDASKGGSLNWSPQTDLRTRFGLPKDALVAINFCAPDEVVDYIGIDVEETADRIARFESDYVFAINFSLYSNYPAFDSHVNLRQRFRSLEALQNRGLRVVPSVAWLEYRQRRRVLDWLRDNGVTAVMRNLQTLAVASDTEQWRTTLEDLAYLREALPGARLFLVGCSSPSRLRTILERVEGPLTFIDARAQRLAEFHKTVEGVEVRDLSVPDLFAQNVRTVMRWAEVDRGRARDELGQAGPGDHHP